MTNKTSSIPSPEKMFLEVSLYKSFTLLYNDLPKLIQILYYEGIIDCYCPSCEKQSTFNAIMNYPNTRPLNALYPGNINEEHLQEPFEELKNGMKHYVNKKFYCSRNKEHTMAFAFLLDGKGNFMKIGQHPSIADLTSFEMLKYRKILRDKYSEFNKGIGLASHGIGIGSFVYLRRVFEQLIEEAHTIAQNMEDWDEELYQQSRMAEKINLLSPQLPSFLVENRTIYGILSKGVHSLTEEECLGIFPSVKLAIELILDEKAHQLEQERKIRKSSSTLSSIHQSFLKG